VKLEDSPLFEDLKKIFPSEDQKVMLKNIEDELLEGFRKGVIAGTKAGQKKYEKQQAGVTLNKTIGNDASNN